jgi:hypothetical protein
LSLANSATTFGHSNFQMPLVTPKNLIDGGSEWGSNPPATGNLPPAGFEDRDDHRTACASV